MNCNNCGFENAQDALFCKQCGAQLQTPEVAVNPVAEKILGVLKDKLFFVICILVTASAGLALLSGGIQPLTILFSVFLWLIYSQSQKGIVNAEYIKNVSGTVYANYIINNVLGSIIIVVGIVLGILFSFSGIAPKIAEALKITIGNYSGNLAALPTAMATIAGILFTVIFIVAGATVLVLNFFSIRQIHKFVKSTYKSVMSGVFEIEKIQAARIWLMVMGIIAAVSALFTGSALTILAGGASAAAGILASLLIKKHIEE